MQKGTLERRALEVRASGGRIEGYAAVWNSPSADLGGFVETIAQGAFSASLRRGDDVLALYHHDTRAVLGRRSSGTLRLAEDAHGLAFSLDVANTSAGRDALELVTRGDVTGASFGFSVRRDAWEKGAQRHRTLLEVDLFEITLTATPAYAATHVARRTVEHLARAMRRARYLEHLEAYHGLR